jgi:hypothetical protein
MMMTILSLFVLSILDDDDERHFDSVSNKREDKHQILLLKMCYRRDVESNVIVSCISFFFFSESN